AIDNHEEHLYNDWHIPQYLSLSSNNNSNLPSSIILFITVTNKDNRKITVRLIVSCQDTVLGIIQRVLTMCDPSLSENSFNFQIGAVSDGNVLDDCQNMTLKVIGSHDFLYGGHKIIHYQ